jgi:hypothetical protein
MTSFARLPARWLALGTLVVAIFATNALAVRARLPRTVG